MKVYRERRRGLALLTTLIILSLLLALIAAFLTVNQAGNRFTLSSVERARAQDVCLAAMNYAWFKLEKQRQWGVASGIPGTESDQFPHTNSKLKMDVVQNAPVVTVQGKYSDVGDFLNPSATFTMKVENNLKERKTLPGADGPVPPRSVRISVESQAGGVVRNLVTVLRPVPITHDSLAAGRNVNLEETQGLLRIESRDPYINRIRANKNLNLGDAGDVKFLKHGMATSFAELNLGGNDLATASDDAVRQAGETSGGVYLPNPGGAAPVVKPFDLAGITLPEEVSNVSGGTWTFGEATKVEFIPHNLRFSTPPAVPFGPPGEGQTTRYQKKTSLYDKLTSPTGQHYLAGTAIEGSTVLDPPNAPAGHYSSEGEAQSYGYSDTSGEGFSVPPTGVPSDVHTLAPGFQVNVKTAQMVVHARYRLRVSGDFIVVGTGARLPELYFGYSLSPGGVATQQSLAAGIEEAQNHPEKYMAAIVADGAINVTGGVLGYGSMIAGGDLTIKASSGLRAAPDLGVVVKGKRIIINPATEPEPAFPGEPVDADYPIFRAAIQAESGGNWSQYNAWLDHEQPVRDTIIESLSAVSSGDTGPTLWATLCAQIGSSLPAPDFASYGWPPGPLSVGNYIRMKEFLQTRASGYNGGAGDETWLDLGVRQSDTAGRVAAVLNGAAQWARSYKQSFQQYLTTPDQGVPEMFLAGLIYADEDIIVNATDKSVRFEGAVVARAGDMSVAAARKIDLVYNRTLLDDITASGNVGIVRLEKVFVTID